MEAAIPKPRLQFKDLTPFHRALILQRAKAWKKSHFAQILRLISMAQGQAIPPEGSELFSPENWTGPHWNWFRLIQHK